MITPIILCGGLGTRLWPLSTPTSPKQFLDICGDGISNLEVILQKLLSYNAFTAPIIVCANTHLDLISKLQKKYNLTNARIIVEPLQKNTAPAVSAAINYLLLHSKPDQLVMVFPADIYFASLAQVLNHIDIITEQAGIGCFGISPTHPNTAFGYLKKGKAIKAPLFKVNKFFEKPDLVRARKFVAQGTYLWNSGMFLGSLYNFRASLIQHAPDIYYITEQAIKAAYLLDEYIFLQKAIFQTCPNIAFDKAIMEKEQNIWGMELATEWADLGCWQSLMDLPPTSHSHITIRDCTNCYTYIPNTHAILLGLQDIAVIQTAKHLVIGTKQQVAKLTAPPSFTKENYAPTDWGGIRSSIKFAAYNIEFVQILAGHTMQLEPRVHFILVLSGKAILSRTEKIKQLRPGEIYAPGKGGIISNNNTKLLSLMLIRAKL